MSAAGAPVGAGFRIGGPNAIPCCAAPVMAYDPTTNQFLVVWQDAHNISTRGDDIQGRRVAG